MPKTKIQPLAMPVPIIHPRMFVAIAAEHHLHGKDLLRQAGLKSNALAEGQENLPFEEFERLVSTIIAAMGESDIGFEAGWRLPPTAYGSFGYALLCCSTLEETLRICLRYWHLIGPGLNVTASINDDECVVNFLPLVEVHSLIIGRIMMESTLASVYHGFQLILGNKDIHGEIWFDFPEPAYSAKIRQRVPNVKYNMPGNHFRFASELLSQPLPMANPTGLQFALNQCEREEKLKGLSPNQLLARAQNAMLLGIKGYPTLDALAQQLNMTSRTLRRKLSLEGSKYSMLLEEARRRDAVKLLDNRSLEIQKVAELLGYADPANFTRAFKQWTGQTPSDYRITRDN